MTYTLEADNRVNLKAKGTERILQNGANILSVIKGEVVLGRAIGVNGDIVDSPITKASEIINIKKQFEKYEPRLKVHKVTYEADHQRGILKPCVEVSIVE
jgi:phage baseplate assembly protein W